MNRSCPGTSTNASRRARRQRRPGEAEVDGQPAAALLGPAVGLHAGERAHQRGLAVVDVTGGRDHVHRRRHLQHGGGQRVVVAPGGDAAQVEQRAGRRSTRPTTGGAPQAQRLGEGARQRHGGAGQRVLRRPSPADARPRRRRPPPRRRGRQPARPARGRGPAGPSRSAREHRLHRRHRAAQRRLQRGQGGLVDPQRAVERVPPQPLRPARPGPAPARPAGRRAACRRWPATRSAPSASVRLQVRLVGQPRVRARAARSRRRRPAGRRCRPAPRRARATSTARVKPRTTKFDGCTLSTTPVSGAERAAVVGERDPVGRADLAQPGAGGLPSARGCGSRRRSRRARRGR